MVLAPPYFSGDIGYPKCSSARAYSYTHLRYNCFVLLSPLMKSANQEAACRLEKAVFGETGSKMVAKTKKGIAGNPLST